MNKEKFLNDLKPCITDNQKLKVHNNVILDMLEGNTNLTLVSNGEFVDYYCTLENALSEFGFYTIVVVDLENYTYTGTFVLNDTGAYVLMVEVFDTIEPYYIVINYNSNVITAIKLNDINVGKDLNEYAVYIFKNNAVNL